MGLALGLLGIIVFATCYVIAFNLWFVGMGMGMGKGCAIKTA